MWWVTLRNSAAQKNSRITEKFANMNIVNFYRHRINRNITRWKKEKGKTEGSSRLTSSVSLTWETRTVVTETARERIYLLAKIVGVAFVKWPVLMFRVRGIVMKSDIITRRMQTIATHFETSRVYSSNDFLLGWVLYVDDIWSRIRNSLKIGCQRWRCILRERTWHSNIPFYITFVNYYPFSNIFQIFLYYRLTASCIFADTILTELLLLLTGAFIAEAATSACPWAQHMIELENSCICDYNLAQELSVQCDIVNYEQLLAAMRHYAANTPIDLFYINNSTIGVLRNGSLAALRISNMQLSGCRIRSIEPDAFKNQENTLKSLNLRDNELMEIPSVILKTLKNLTVLDLSMNKITKVNDNAFVGSKLITLKLSDNEITLAPNSFRGLEKTLKNLNLKGTRQKKVPDALRGLKSLAFLDLSQNSIRELPGTSGTKAFEGLESLTGLNLERNLIQNIGPDAFHGIKNTLSSLSLLNNLIPDFPTAAVNSVHDLRVSNDCIKSQNCNGNWRFFENFKINYKSLTECIILFYNL